MAIYGLISEADAKSFLDLGSSTAKDYLLEILMNGITAEFERLAGRYVWTEARTEYQDAYYGQHRIMVKAWPVSASPALQLYIDVDRNFGTDTLVDTTAYALNTAEGIIELDTAINSEVAQSIKIIYTGGLAAKSPVSGQEVWTLYPDLARAALAQLVFEWNMLPELGRGSVSIKGSSVTIRDKLGLVPEFCRICGAMARGEV